jgi:hypothetical protein
LNSQFCPSNQFFCVEVTIIYQFFKIYKNILLKVLSLKRKSKKGVEEMEVWPTIWAQMNTQALIQHSTPSPILDP